MKIVFAHNVYNRLKTLRDTILIEKKYFEHSNISVAYNDIYVNIFQEISNLSFISFNEKEHKIGCINGCILSIQQLLDFDFDVLIFSHDDVRINEKYIDVVYSNINEIINNKYDLICRMPDGYGNYYMMEVFYLSKNAASLIFSNLLTLKSENEIPLDLRLSKSPEVWLYNIFNNNNNLKIKEIKYHQNDDNYNIILGENMGYYHNNAGLRGWREL